MDCKVFSFLFEIVILECFRVCDAFRCCIFIDNLSSRAIFKNIFLNCVIQTPSDLILLNLKLSTTNVSLNFVKKRSLKYVSFTITLILKFIFIVASNRVNQGICIKLIRDSLISGSGRGLELFIFVFTLDLYSREKTGGRLKLFLFIVHNFVFIFQDCQLSLQNLFFCLLDEAKQFALHFTNGLKFRVFLFPFNIFQS